ncbi:MAG TPA: xanthine dehydrogenase family protein subunit M [Actinomycetes bacterium]
MIPAAFAYERPGSLGEAIGLLAEHGDDAKALAGGQSLIPLLKLRLAAPELVVDLGDLAQADGLAGVRDQGDHLAIGALTRHAALAGDPLAAQHTPLLADAASQVGDPQVRHFGTLGGSLAHADPAADLPAVLLAYEATMVARGPHGQRELPVAEFLTGFLETALQPDELVVEIRVPKLGPGIGWSFRKFTRRAIDWATVGVAVLRGPGLERVALVNMGPTPLRAAAVEEALLAGAAVHEAAEAATEGTEPTSDAWASAWYRRRLAPVLVRRALEEAATRSDATR